jgi:hypothetical protein
MSVQAGGRAYSQIDEATVIGGRPSQTYSALGGPFRFATPVEFGDQRKKSLKQARSRGC